jgi:Reverse transcriptase (RNA-dependent DNA polymerase)
MRNKFTNHGDHCMFIGYAEDQISILLKFYNPKTRAFLMSRNVYWLNKSYCEFYKVLPNAGNAQVSQAHRMMAEADFDLPDMKDTSSNTVARAMIPHFNPIQPPEPDEIPPPNFDNDNASIQSDASAPDSPEPDTNDTAAAPVEPYSWTRMPRTRGMRRLARQLTTSYNPAPLASTSPTLSEDAASTSPSEEADFALEAYCAPHEMAFAAGLPESTVYLQTLRAALSTPISLDWWKAVCNEFDNCETKKVWTIVKKYNVPKGRKIIVNRWVFARNDDGRYRARTVAKGFSQFPGQDFHEKPRPCYQ